MGALMCIFPPFGTLWQSDQTYQQTDTRIYSKVTLPLIAKHLQISFWIIKLYINMSLIWNKNSLVGNKNQISFWLRRTCPIKNNFLFRYQQDKSLRCFLRDFRMSHWHQTCKFTFLLLTWKYVHKQNEMFLFFF